MRSGHLSQIVGSILAGFVLLIAGSSCSIPAGAQGSQGAANGKALFEKRCGGCHSMDRDGEGPRLGGVYGRTSGSIDSFQYSDAVKKSKIKWAEDTLDKWLTDTEKVVPNNDMAFRVQNPDERNAIIAYLKQSSAK
jgi:cytochrome c